MNKFLELIDVKQAKWKGIPTLAFLALLVVSLVVLYYPNQEGVTGGYVQDTFIVTFAILAILGILFGEIGERIPIWNEYIGGGTILVFFVGSLLATYGVLPEVFVEQTDGFYDVFLDMFIPCLIMGSVLTVNRAILLKSFAGYIPLILVGLAGASAFGIAAGLVVGKEPTDVMLNYVLPIMGGGTGAGATPLSEMYEKATGNPAQNWFAFAVSILTIANIFAILAGALLNALGKKRPNLTGNGQLLIVNQDSIKEVKEPWEDIKSSQQSFFLGFVFTGIMFLVSGLLSEIWEIYGPAWLQLHKLAILVLLAIFLNAVGIVPQQIKAGCKDAQNFFSKFGLWVLMFAVGTTTDFQEIINALTVSNVIIALAIVVGAVVSIMLVSRLFKFYPIEAAITAGLCMANRGGSGDVAVLGAANRMELMSFGQISSRIGGAMVLVLGGILFSMFA